MTEEWETIHYPNAIKQMNLVNTEIKQSKSIHRIVDIENLKKKKPETSARNCITSCLLLYADILDINTIAENTIIIFLRNNGQKKFQKFKALVELMHYFQPFIQLHGEEKKQIVKVIYHTLISFYLTEPQQKKTIYWLDTESDELIDHLVFFAHKHFQPNCFQKLKGICLRLTTQKLSE